jgi:hypothetical protein
MQQPPHHDDRRNDEQTDRLITHEGTALGDPAFSLGNLFVMRLDAGVDHENAFVVRSACGGPELQGPV